MLAATIRRMVNPVGSATLPSVWRNRMRGLGSLLCAMALMAGCDGADPRPMGTDDAAAAALCNGFGGAAIPLTAAATEAEAADVVVTMDGLFEVTLPDGAESYAMIRTDEMHTTLAIGASPQGALANLSVGLPGATASAVCPDVVIDEHRVHIHANGDYLLTFSDEGPRTVLLFTTAAEIGHPEGDGGAHHDHDGGHHHDHDAGTHHDHDGGAHHDHDAGAHHDHDGGHHH